MAQLIFVRFSLFLISAHSKNLIHVAVTVINSKLWRTRLKGIPLSGTPYFSRTKVLPDIFNRSNSEYMAFSGLKADSIRRKGKKSKKKEKEKKKGIQVGVNEQTKRKVIDSVIKNYKPFFINIGNY